MQTSHSVGVVTVADIHEKTRIGKNLSLRRQWAMTAETVLRRVLVRDVVEYHPEPA